MSAQDHPKLVQNIAFALGVVAVFVFAVAFSLFAYNVYNAPVSADSASELKTCTTSFNDLQTKLGKIKLSAEDKAKLDGISMKFKASGLKLSDCGTLLGEIKQLHQKVTGSSQAETSLDEGGAGTVQGTTGNDFEYLSKQDYSAVAISGWPESPGCKEKKVGQVVVVTDIKDFAASGDKRVEVVVSTGGFFSKRGTLQKISASYTTKIIESYSGSKVADSANLTKDQLVSGLYFPNVPVDSALKVQLYSPSWGSKSIAMTNIRKVSGGCETVFVPVIGLQPKDQDMDVCVHSTDRAADYSPKKTFTYPAQKDEATKFKESNKGSIISLGPCQDASELVKKINSAGSLGGQTDEQKKASSIGYTGNPGGSSGTSQDAQTAQGTGSNTKTEELIKNIAMKYAPGSDGKTRYKYMPDGDGPSSFDCSGFVHSVLKQVKEQGGNVIIGSESHTSAYSNIGKLIHSVDLTKFVNSSGASILRSSKDLPSTSILRPGDLLFFGTSSTCSNKKLCPNTVGHVAIYIGDGKYIHSTTSDNDLTRDSASAGNSAVQPPISAHPKGANYASYNGVKINDLSDSYFSPKFYIMTRRVIQ